MLARSRITWEPVALLVRRLAGSSREEFKEYCFGEEIGFLEWLWLFGAVETLCTCSALRVLGCSDIPK